MVTYIIDAFITASVGLCHDVISEIFSGEFFSEFSSLLEGQVRFLDLTGVLLELESLLS